MKLIYRITRTFLRIFYSKELLDGKWFTKYHIGYLWAIKSIPRRIRWKNIKVPYSKTATIFNGKNLSIAPSSINCLQSDIYLQNRQNKVSIGENCYIAQHCGIITEQHNVYNLDEHVKGQDVIIGDGCWIGMNSVIMPGVVLGNHTIVGANSVVTKSFEKGNVVLGGTPAKIIKQLEADRFDNNYSCRKQWD